MSEATKRGVGTIGGYTVLRREPLERLEGAFIELEHERTGARHIHIECGDDNNGFTVLFPTPPRDPRSGLRYKGVVFNEMKGALASPAAAMQRAMGKALFSGLTYEHVSGGDPEHIPELTWQKLRDFHASHYHPSNAFFYTYGDRPLESTLEAIERNVLSRFERIIGDASIPFVKRFTQPVGLP